MYIPTYNVYTHIHTHIPSIKIYKNMQLKYISSAFHKYLHINCKIIASTLAYWYLYCILIVSVSVHMYVLYIHINFNKALDYISECDVLRKL